ncbi:MAG: HAMP domain-containing histidine kinase [Lachnospiraceae bacterium]|nr:HAMP domain-containing histidine kinase [Lachnospiraceae bacterium]
MTMFKQSRRKILAAIMGILVLFMAMTMSVVYGISYLQTKKQNSTMLEQYMARFDLNSPSEDHLLPPDDGKDPRPDGGFRPWDERDDREGRNERTFMGSIFYAVAFSEDKEVLKIENSNAFSLKDEEVVALAKEILSSGKTSGKRGDLLYRVEQKEDCTLVAFNNTAVTNDNMRILLRQMLLVGAAAIVVIFFIAHWLAYRIVKPLEENDRRQKQFVSDAGHELKTPVAVISANTELLSRELGQNEWLSNIQYETERMGTLVTQLLDLSHAENAEVQTEEIDLSRLVTGETLPFESVAFEAGLEIDSRIEDNVFVEGNRTQLGQLTAILLDNAIRHAEGGKSIVIRLTKEHKTAVLSVENSGKPIDPKMREKLFERFYRADEARNSEGRHYGLGLAIAKAIAEGHRGTIGVDCPDGKVVFSVRLPAAN